MSTPNQWEDPSADLAKMKILIIDDEPVNVALLEEILVEAGYTRFESILDSKLALQIYKTFLPDLVLLDLMMPPPGSPFWNRSVPMLAIHFCRS